MSVQNEIDRINNNIANTYTTLNEAGATMPGTRNSNNLSATAASISAILFNKAQNLTAAQQRQARANISAISEVDVPKKGVDYWTETDQESIVQQVIAALGTPVYGTVDENKHITLSGHLADGTYTLSFEDTDGFTAELCALNKTSGPSYTNQIPISTDTDGSIFNGTGWIANKRLNSSGAVADVGSYGYTGVTGFIPIADGDVLRTSENMIDPSGSTQQNACFYKADKTFLIRLPYYPNKASFNYTNLFTENDDNSFVYTHDTSESAVSDAAFVRFSLVGITDGAIITKNEEIV